jgi:hypothetical protein
MVAYFYEFCTASTVFVVQVFVVQAGYVRIPSFSEIFDEYTTALEDFIERELVQV